MTGELMPGKLMEVGVARAPGLGERHPRTRAAARSYLNHLVVDESHRRLGVGRPGKARRGRSRGDFQKRQPAGEGRMGCVSSA